MRVILVLLPFAVNLQVLYALWVAMNVLCWLQWIDCVGCPGYVLQAAVDWLHGVTIILDDPCHIYPLVCRRKDDMLGNLFSLALK